MNCPPLVYDVFAKNNEYYYGPFVDFYCLNKYINTYAAYNLFRPNTLHIDIFYFCKYTNKINFQFNVNGFDINKSYTINTSQTTKDIYANLYNYRLSLFEITTDNEEFNIIREIPYMPLKTASIQEYVFSTDLLMDIYYGKNKYNINNKNKDDIDYIEKIKKIYFKHNDIETDFKDVT